MSWGIDRRRELLGSLYRQISVRQQDILNALWVDLHKNEGEAYMSELGLVLREIRLVRSSMCRWLSPRRVRTPLFLWPSRSKIIHEPYGKVLIIAPWNYPFQLTLLPLIGAVAAGNSVVVKCSPYAPHTERIIREIIEAVFEPDHVKMETGGADKVSELLSQQWDYIFFTGSTATGRIVARAAAEHLTPVTLELGGKSPCVVTSSCNLKIAARRIIWGKFLNAGQTCVAPDYVLCDQKIYDLFVDELNRAKVALLGQDAKLSDNFGRIVSRTAFDRLVNLYPQAINDPNELYIAPTIVKLENDNHPLMREEIFGPILVVMSYQTTAQAIEYINTHAIPLALYAFGSKIDTHNIVSNCPSGSASVNDTVIQLSNSSLPFGGLAQSGMGSYHGRHSVETFSHQRSVIYSSKSLDLKLRYRPMKYLKLIKTSIK